MMKGLSKLARLLYNYFKLPFAEKVLLVEALIWLGLARFAILTLPFRCIAPILGRKMVESSEANSGIDLLRLKKISRAINAIGRYTPWKSNCFASALACKVMLKTRRMKSTVYFGVARDENGTMIAHAWLRCGSLILTGAQGSEKYTVTATFAEKEGV